MKTPSETLTVSFGTFSCTVEGAENPLDTMMAVTEFFRDLAENDRYFAAEPPMVEHDAIGNGYRSPLLVN